MKERSNEMNDLDRRAKVITEQLCNVGQAGGSHEVLTTAALHLRTAMMIIACAEDLEVVREFFAEMVPIILTDCRDIAMKWEKEKARKTAAREETLP